MALQSSDLFVIQSQTDNQLYKLRVDDLLASFEGGSGINFRGSVDLNNAPGDQVPAVTLPATNGDLYIVESDCPVINAGWVMVNGETAASEGDRIIYDEDSNGWILVVTGGGGTGTVIDIVASLCLLYTSDAADE